ncbi:MAG TPA: alpha/beta fold hydrolase [Sphingobium sp.]|uniref:alpha/beta hydrolase n=1 Tax=Sphingobium sp. TaxID=1912891 RepID=UPI002ED2794D
MRIAVSLMLAMSLTAASPAPEESYVQAAGPDGPLKGTMLSPGGFNAPVILMIPGSGPTDRDGNNPLGVKAASLKLLAEGLAARGIATVRIDKRGMFASAGAVPDANAVTIDDYATDVHVWVDAIRQRTNAKCVWLLGHSEGGLVALRAGQRAGSLCGIILVSTPGRPLGTVLRDQLKANPANAPLLDQANAAISDLEAGKHVDMTKLPPALAQLFRPNVQDFLINAMALDPAKMLASYRDPVLILQGTRDIQVSVEDANLLKAARPSATLVLLPDTNHVLKVVTSDSRAANIATYADPGLPLAPEVVPSIARFIESAK